MEAEEKKRLNELALSVLKLSRNTLVIQLRFMDTAISRLKWVSLPELLEKQPAFSGLAECGLMTNGNAIFYDPLTVCRLYAHEKEAGPHAYLHMVMHCVFRHFLVGATFHRKLWDIACDMAVEGVILGLNLPAVDTNDSDARKAELDKIAPEVNHLLTAEKIYYRLQGANLSEKRISALHTLFHVDDHGIWYPENQPKGEDGERGGKTGSEPKNKGSSEKSGDKPENGESNASASDPSDDQGDNASTLSEASAREELERDWREISEHMQTDMETFHKTRGDEAGSMMQNLREVNREKYDYTDFLKKFAVMGETMKLNDDEFDYIFYTYGMRLFPERRMPLIEPLEYKETKKIREFVIAIDTSGSVVGDEVQSFLQKTYNILKNTDSFFSRINLHMIQCDAEIQEDVKITSQEEFDRYLSHLKLKGFGGTDFRPVFQKVDEMIRDKEFSNLKGLIYFTDGYGVFPEKKPAYKTAFVFVQSGYEIPEVPPWAIKLVLQKEELKEMKS